MPERIGGADSGIAGCRLPVAGFRLPLREDF